MSILMVFIVCSRHSPEVWVVATSKLFSYMLNNSKLFVWCKCWSGSRERCMCFLRSFHDLRACVLCSLLLVFWRNFFATFSWCYSSKLDHPLELWTWSIVAPLELGTLVATPLELGAWLVVLFKLWTWSVVVLLELWTWSFVILLKLWTWSIVAFLNLGTSIVALLELGTWSVDASELGTLVAVHFELGTLTTTLLELGT